MNSRAIVGVALMGAVVLVSCSQDQTSAPLLPTESSLARTTPVNYCSFSTINTTARDYFASRTDGVYGLITTMNNAYKVGGVSGVATNNAGFDVLGRLGVAADAGSSLVKGTAAQGSAFANAVLKCMTVTGFTPSDAQVINFAPALGATGLFAVRSNAQSTAVKSRGLDADGAAMFGAEPTTNGTSSNWPIKTSGGAAGEAVSPSGKALFYGVKTLENTQTLASENLSSLAFELHTLPTPLTFTPKIRVGVCSIDNLSARTIHKHGLETSILAPTEVLSFCPTSSAAISPKASGLAYATQRIASWFAPKPLVAFAFRGGGGAGLVDGLSEFGAVEFTPAITWNQKPLSTTVRATTQFPNVVTLTVKTLNGTVYRGTVELTVVGNNGSYNIEGNVKDTDENGVVTFPDLHIDKAGGYDMTAVTGIGNSETVTFWITGN
jgi:hypothetical protein